jgi:hypothetical protein
MVQIMPCFQLNTREPPPRNVYSSMHLMNAPRIYTYFFSFLSRNHQPTLGWTKWIVSSRNWPDIERDLKITIQLELRLEL